jgi:hypothetical protein
VKTEMSLNERNKWKMGVDGGNGKIGKIGEGSRILGNELEKVVNEIKNEK